MMNLKQLSHKLHAMQIRRAHLGALGKVSQEQTIRHCGQPTAESHPHLIPKGNVLPNITADELWTRREKLAQMVKDTMKKRHQADITQHMIVIPSASKCYMSEKIPYVFRQNSDFLYLSGCQEPDTCLVINVDTEKPSHTCTLFVRERDSHSEIWDGPRTDPNDASRLFGVDTALPVKELGNYLQKHRQTTSKPAALWFDNAATPQESIAVTVREHLQACKQKICDSPRQLVHKLRVVKSPAEIALMRRSCDIAAESMQACMRHTRDGVGEHQLNAVMDYECRMRGAEYLAYPPVIAGGERGTIIHYINNNQLLRDGEIVLMDAGCEYHGYSSDITRAWPVNGVFNKEQRVLYEVLLNVQLKCVELLRNQPRVTLDKLFEDMCLVLGRGLQEIGLCPKTTSIATTIKQAYQFCPHHVSHYLGMDVHDTALIPRNIPVQNGMIVTVEPGVYIGKNIASSVPVAYRGLGMRIEDDILITENGPEVLTEKVPRTVDDIQNLMMRK